MGRAQPVDPGTLTLQRSLARWAYEEELPGNSRPARRISVGIIFDDIPEFFPNEDIDFLNP